MYELLERLMLDEASEELRAQGVQMLYVGDKDEVEEGAEQ